MFAGQAGSNPPPPHTPEEVTVTVQVYEPAEESVTGEMMTVLVRVVLAFAATKLFVSP